MIEEPTHTENRWLQDLTDDVKGPFLLKYCTVQLLSDPTDYMKNPYLLEGSTTAPRPH
jgi:hypothetical protein